MNGHRKQRTSQLPIIQNEDFHVMQEFTNPAGPRIEDTEKPHPNEGGSHDNGIPPKTPVDDTAVQMNGAETLPVKAKKLDLDKPEDFQDKFWKSVDNVTVDWSKLAKDNKDLLQRIMGALLLVMYFAYLIYISVRDVQEAMVMLVLTALCFVTFIYVIIRDNFGAKIWNNCCKPSWNFVQDIWENGKWVFLLLSIVGIAVGLFLLTRGNPKQLISAVGLLVFVLFTYIFSKNPRQVKWRPVVWGLVLQFILGIFILRTDLGYNIFQSLGCIVRDFLDFSDAGAKFVFGEDTYKAHFFAFKVLPVVIYFSAVISVLYHLGIMQIVIRKLAWLMQKTMKTSASESLNAAGNIFIGQTEAPLLIRPLLKDMTSSELHAVMTGGFATIAGSVLGAYITFGISPSHLLTASVMSAPAALAVSKLFYPKTKETSNKTVDQIELPKSEHRNIIEAASYGAYTAVPLALNIAGNLIAFLALLAFLNGLLGYFGGLAGLPELSFEWICSYLFIPVAFLMGVDVQDCREVARLVGLKTFVNEFFAYEELSTLIRNRVNGIEPSISIRSEIIATYALCGFANIGSIGIQLGGLTSMAPSRKKDLAKVAVRALIAGTVACFMTACVAGVLYDEAAYDGGMALTDDNMCGRISLFTTPKPAESLPNQDFSTLPAPNISTSPTLTFTLTPTSTPGLSQFPTFTLTPTSTFSISPSTTFYLVATSEEPLPSTHQPPHPPAHQPHHSPVDHHNQSPTSTFSPTPKITTRQTSEPPHPPAHQPHHSPVDHHNQSPTSTFSPTSKITTKQTSEPSHPPAHQPHHPPVDHHNQSPTSTFSPTPQITTKQKSEPPHPSAHQPHHPPAHQPHHSPVDHHNQSPTSTFSPTPKITTRQTSEPPHPPAHQPHHSPVDHHNQSPTSTFSPTPKITTKQTSEPPHPPTHQPHHPPVHNPHH